MHQTPRTPAYQGPIPSKYLVLVLEKTQDYQNKSKKNPKNSTFFVISNRCLHVTEYLERFLSQTSKNLVIQQQLTQAYL